VRPSALPLVAQASVTPQGIVVDPSGVTSTQIDVGASLTGPHTPTKLQGGLRVEILCEGSSKFGFIS
jgi:hypothetical protein